MKKISAKMLLPIILLSFALASCNGGSSDSVSDSSDNSVDPETTYTVSFDLNYSGAPAAPAPQTIQVNGLVEEPTDPTRNGYDFTFWATDLYGADEWDFTADVVTADMTLYAGWSVAQVEDKVYYVDIPEFWKADGAGVAMYAWEGEVNNTFPGVRMNNVAGDIYSYALSSEYTNFIFVRVSPPDEPITDWGAKTIDLSVDAAGSNNLFTIAETVQWGDPGCQGTWSVYSAQLSLIFSKEKEYIYV